MTKDPHQLWERWRSRGDARAFEMLVRPDLGRAVAFAREAGCPPGEAEDAVQESLLRLARETGASPSRVGVRGWFFGIVRDRARARRRAQRRRHTREHRAATREAARDPDPGLALAEDVERALALLPEEDRRVVRLRYLFDLEYREVAHLLGLSEGACRVRVHRALKLLRRTLGGGAGAALAAVAFPAPARAATWIESAAAAAPAPATTSAIGGALVMTATQKTVAGALAAVLLLTIGAGVGVTVAPSLRSAPAAPPAAPPEPGPAADSAGAIPSAPRPGLTEAEIRRIIREELARVPPRDGEAVESPSASPRPAQSEEVRESVRRTVLDLRKTYIEQDLRYEMGRVQPRVDPGRLARIPDERVWPEDILGWVEHDPARYQVLDSDGSGFDPLREEAAWVFTGPLDRPIVTSRYATLVFEQGIAETGVVTLQSYGTIFVKGDMRGKLYIESYATVVIEGDLIGSVESESYANVLVKGALTGSFKSKSSANLRVMRGIRGKLDLASRASLYLGGYTTRATLAALDIQKRASVTLESSDLSPGTHPLGKHVQVTVLEPR